MGGSLWAGFDCQRGYHPDPFWGGILDVFRQPEYSYELFRSQRDTALQLSNADSGPMILIAALKQTENRQTEVTAAKSECAQITHTNCGNGV
jgi:beta-galactosidase